MGRCKRHGGSTQTHVVAAEAELLRQTADRLGIPRPTDPGTGLLDLIAEAAGNVEFYRSLVAELPTHPEDDRLVPDDGETPAHYERGAPGIYGRTYHVSGIPTGEAKRVILVQMYDDERDRLKGYISEALRHGLEERRVRLAEASARDLFAGVMHAATLANMTTEQLEVFRRELADHIRRSRPTQLAS